MFNWLRKPASNPAPKAPRPGENSANPAIGSVANWAFSKGRRTWQESMNLLETLARLLTERGRTVRADGPVILDVASQLSLRPLLSNMQPGQNSVRTSTTIEIKHPTRIPSPVFEFQHSAGPDLETSLMAGVRQWYDSDFVELLDAAREKAVDWADHRHVGAPWELLAGREVNRRIRGDNPRTAWTSADRPGSHEQRTALMHHAPLLTDNRSDYLGVAGLTVISRAP